MVHSVGSLHTFKFSKYELNRKTYKKVRAFFIIKYLADWYTR